MDVRLKPILRWLTRALLALAALVILALAALPLALQALGSTELRPFVGRQLARATGHQITYGCAGLWGRAIG